MKKSKKFWLVLSSSMVVLALGAVMILKNSAILSLSAQSELVLTANEVSFDAENGIQVTLTDNRAESELTLSGDSATLPSATSLDGVTSTDSSSVEKKREWTMVLPAGVTFNEDLEQAYLTKNAPEIVAPSFNWDATSNTLQITAETSVTSLPLIFVADAAGEYSFTASSADDSVTSQTLVVEATEATDTTKALTALTGTTAATAAATYIGISRAAAGTAEVTDWQTFVEALADSSITNIVLQNNITLSGTLLNYNSLFSTASADLTSAQNVYLYINKSGTARSLVINGQGYTFDFANLAIGFLNASSTAGTWNLNFTNINMISSNYSGPFFNSSFTSASGTSDGLSGTARTKTNLVYDSTCTNTRLVSDFLGYMIGLNNPYLTNVELTTDVVVPAGTNSTNYYIYSPYNNSSSAVCSSATSFTNTSGTIQQLYFYNYGNVHTLVVDGKGYTMDFGSVCLWFTEYNRTGTSQYWDVTFKNMVVYHGNYYGATCIYSSSSGYFTYDNYTDYGTQVLESRTTKLTCRNNVYLEQQATYTSVRKDGSTIRNWTVNNALQQSLKIANFVVEDNANVTIKTRGTNGIMLDGTTADPANFIVGKNATVTIEKGNEVTTSEDSPINLQIATGNFTVGEGSVVNLINHNSTNSGTMALTSSGSAVKIAKNATVNVTVDNCSTGGNNTAVTNPIFLASGGSINVAGSLNVKMTNAGSSATYLIDGYGTSGLSFIIASGGSLDLQSDSTSTSQYLIYMYGSSSIFQFSDAERVNLQRTNTMSSASTTNNGLISSGGKLDVSVQNVYQWNLNNQSGGTTSDTGYDFSYIPMSNMVLSYSTYTPTITSANSMTSATRASFIANFTTRGQQRVLFTRIPDPSVAIYSIANDNPTLTSTTVINSTNISYVGSTTVCGYALPNTYVRLWEEALNGTTSAKAKGTGDTVASPVEDTTAPADYLSNFTVKADANGYWTYTLPAGSYFTAGNVVHAYAFANLKAEEVTQTVLDKTAPTATGVTYYIAQGDALPAASSFVTNVADTSPINTGFDYAYTDSAAVDALRNTPGTYTIPINVSDQAVDADGNASPNTAVVNATLVVYPSASSVTGDNLEVPFLDIRSLTDAQLSAYILANCNPNAYSLNSGSLKDLTQYITVTNFGGLNNYTSLTPNTQYAVTLTVPANSTTGLSTPISTTIQVTVINMNATLTVQFVDEANNIMSGYNVTVSGIYVGDTVNLATNTDVQAKITQLETAGYNIVTRPTNESALPITTTDQTVQYQVTGLLYLQSAPNQIDFGSVTYDATVKRVDNPTTDADLKVADTRADKSSGWQLYAKETTAMTNTTDATAVLSGSLRYVTGTGSSANEITLNSGSQEVYASAAGGSLDITSTWGTTNKTSGVKFVFDPSQYSQVVTGSYVGKITWEIMAGTP